MGRYTGKKCRLVSMFALTSSFFLVEIIVGHITNSMALVADSFHMLSDIAALIIAFISVKMAPKSWDKNTYGWARAEVLGALVNAVFLVALCFSITMESLKRFYEPEEIHDPEMILYVGALGLLVNLLGLCLFHEHGGGHGHSHGGNHGHSHKGASRHGTHSHLAALADDDKDEADHCCREDQLPHDSSVKPVKANSSKGGQGSQMNMRGVFLHVMADALGSVVVIISAVIMWQTDWEYKYYVDPGLSLVMVILMMRSVWPLLIESALILLQTVPTHIEVDTLKKKLLENVYGILAVHEFHVWQLTGDRIIASAHIRCHNLSEYMKVAENIKEFFHNEGIHSTTIQPEFSDYQTGQEFILNEDCVLACPKGPAEEKPNCDASKCCPPANLPTVIAQPNQLTKSTNNSPTLSKRTNSCALESENRLASSQSFIGRNKRYDGKSEPRETTSSSTNHPPPPTTRQSAPNLHAHNSVNIISRETEQEQQDCNEATTFIVDLKPMHMSKILTSKQSNV